MARTKISEFSATPGNNTDIDGINIAEGCAPSGINDAIRELMAQLKDWQSGTSNDPMIIGSSGSLTLSYGTTNGVPYLNGSKVLTSGNALVFDGTNLGIGTSSTLGNSTVNAVLGFAARNNGATPGYFQTYNSNAGADLKTWRLGGDSSGNLVFQTVNDAYSSATTRLTADAAGNLGLGVTPSAWNSSARVFQFGANGTAAFENFNGLTLNAYQNVFRNSSNQFIYATTGPATLAGQFNGAFTWSIAPSGTAGNAISFTQAMTLDSTGRLLVNNTSGAVGYISSWHQAAVRPAYSAHATITGAAGLFEFYNPNGMVGQVYTTGSTTVYATSSDYRLKENIQPMTGALAKVAALKPCTYKWKVDGSDGEGFIAHELQAVVPQCVTGEKDAVDAEGKPVYQGIDTSFLVATLTAAIQELKADLDATKAELAALKG